MTTTIIRRWTVALILLPGWLCGGSAAAVDFISGAKWGSPEMGTPATVTWGLMPTGASSAASDSIVALEDFMPAGYKSQVEAAFAAWSQVANITFVESPHVDASDPQIRIGGYAVDGPGGTAAHAGFPGPDAANGDMHFDTTDAWTLEYGKLTQGELTQNVFAVTMHEIGHTIGLFHAHGIFSVMNSLPSTTEFFQGLLPADILAAQTIYGVAPGYQPPPSANTTLTLTENSFLTLSLDVFNGAITASDTTPLTGTLDTHIASSAPGQATGLAVRDSSIGLDDLSLSFSGLGIDFDATLSGVGSGGHAYSTKDLAIDDLNNFDAGGTMFGMLDGGLSFMASVFGNELEGSVNLFARPLALANPDEETTGSIDVTPTANPFLFDVLVQIPISMSGRFDLSLFSSEIPPGELYFTLSMGGLLEATGQVTMVPEPPAIGLAMTVAACAAAHGLRRQRKHA